MIKKLPFNKFYKIFNLVSFLLIFLSILLLLFKGLNFGVDFKGGTLIELRVDKENIKISDIRNSLLKMELLNLSLGLINGMLKESPLKMRLPMLR